MPKAAWQRGHKDGHRRVEARSTPRRGSDGPSCCGLDVDECREPLSGKECGERHVAFRRR
jgi:hypothetical protein